MVTRAAMELKFDRARLLLGVAAMALATQAAAAQDGPKAGDPISPREAEAILRPSAPTEGAQRGSPGPAKMRLALACHRLSRSEMIRRRDCQRLFRQHPHLAPAGGMADQAPTGRQSPSPDPTHQPAAPDATAAKP